MKATTPTAPDRAMIVRSLGLLAVSVAGLALAGCGSPAASDEMPPPPQVSVAPVLSRHVPQWDDFTGRVEAAEVVELRPPVSGYIERVTYTEGSEVEAGQVLFVIDQRSYRAALDRARADLARAVSEAGLRQTELERARKLSASRAISAEEVDQRSAALAQAEAGVRAAQAAVDTAELDLEFTEVRAPIAGRAGRALVTAGNLVSTQPGASLLTTIVSLDPVHVYFEADEQTYLRSAAMAAQVSGNGSAAGNAVRVGLSGDRGHPHLGRLDFVDNQVDPTTGTIRARAVLPNRGRVLTPGLFARVQLLGNGMVPALLIDDKAVLTDQDRKFVYVVGEDGRAQRRDVVLGRLAEGLRVVESGLEAGDRVIVHGVQKVFFPGMPVQAGDIAMGDPPPGPAAFAAQ